MKQSVMKEHVTYVATMAASDLANGEEMQPWEEVQVPECLCPSPFPRSSFQGQFPGF